MTNSQCVEVAEKVWGLELSELSDDNPEDYDWFESQKYFHKRINGSLEPVTSKDFFLDKNNIEEEINSWQGFGRTVEANVHHIGMDEFNQKMVASYEGFLNGGITKEMLWERTHLYALEAVKVLK